MKSKKATNRIKSIFVSCYSSGTYVVNIARENNIEHRYRIVPRSKAMDYLSGILNTAQYNKRSKEITVSMELSVYPTILVNIEYKRNRQSKRA